MTGQKFDSEKLRFSLIPQGTLRPVVRVLEFGAKKYSEGNWQSVPNARTRYFDAAHRHLDAWWHGEKSDVETGESHLAHAICCLMFLLAMDIKDSECAHIWIDVSTLDRDQIICDKCSAVRDLERTE